jgi:hypothetical protein
VKYQYRSYKVRSNGMLSNSNLNSRPYVTVEEVLRDTALQNDRYFVHDFINDKWFQVVNGWLTSVNKPE